MTIKTEQEHAAARQRISALDWSAAANRLGLVSRHQTLEAPLFGMRHRITLKGCFDEGGQQATMALELLLYRYILDYPDALPPKDQRVSFREIEGSGPLVASFANNTHKIIAGHFADSQEALCSAARKMAGSIEHQNGGYDLLICFDALPGIPLYLQYNAVDEEFPAYAGILFHRSTERRLGLQALFIMGTYLTGRLIQAERPLNDGM